MKPETRRQKETQKIIKETVENMTALGVYRQQFDAAIATYADMRCQLAALNRQFFDGGCKITEQYTNKSGATNERKTALYAAIEQLRRDIASTEDRLGLTPAGLRRINEQELKKKKKASKLDRALSGNGY